MKKRLLAAFFAAVMLASLSACGTASAEKSREITYWTVPFSAENEPEDTLNEMLAEKGIAVSVEVLDRSVYEETLLSATAADNGPDVAYLPSEQLSSYLNAEKIAPIDRYFSEEEQEPYRYWSFGTVDGKQMALPYLLYEPRVLYINKEIFEKAGLSDYPTDWQSLSDTAMMIEKRTGLTGFDQGWGGSFADLRENYLPFLYQSGGSIGTDRKGTVLDSKEAVATAEFLYTLKINGILPANCAARDAQTVFDDFQIGNTAMYIGPASHGALHEAAGVRWDYLPCLTGETAKTVVPFDTLVLMASSDQPKEAAEVMKALTSSELQKLLFAKNTALVPTLAGDTTLGDPHFRDLYAEGPEIFAPMPVIEDSAACYEALFTELQQMMQEKKGPKDALSSADEAVNQKD